MAKKKKKKKDSTRASKAPASPLGKDGELYWSRVELPRVSQPSALSLALPQATMRDQELPFLAWVFGTVAFFGIVFSTSWSPLLLAVLSLVTLLDPRIREHKIAVIQALLSVLLCAACWPLVDHIKSAASLDMTQSAALTLVVFSAALWLTGIVTRRSSMLQNTPFACSGLYGVGIACQTLSVLLMFTGVVQLYILLIS